MDFITLCQRTRQECGASGTGPAAVTGQTGESKRFVDWVVKAERAVRTKWANWKFLWLQGGVPIVAPTAEYDLPNGIVRLDKTSLPLDVQYLTWKEFRKLDPDNTPGTIAAVSIDPSNKLRVWPTPAADSTLLLEGYTKGTDLATTTDVSPVPEEYHAVIVAQAKIYYSEYENDTELMQSAVAEYGYWLKLLEADQLPEENAAVGLGDDQGDLRVEVV